VLPNPIYDPGRYLVHFNQDISKCGAVFTPDGMTAGANVAAYGTVNIVSNPYGYVYVTESTATSGGNDSINEGGTLIVVC
jgi:hypothetical protein